ncbi:hypothetical protein N9359_04470 [Luminiphilus sp.]|nr:hypothetical protein [Luminiphilus sp.]
MKTKTHLMIVPENVTATVLQNYEGNWAIDPSIKILDFGDFSSVAIASNHPEKLDFLLRLKQETDRVVTLIINAWEDGMERPALLDYYGLAFTWDASGGEIHIEPYSLNGYAV